MSRECVPFRERLLNEPGRLSPPIWPCTTRGFPCLRCCHRSGGLLPHLFTLAKRGERIEDAPQVYLRDATVLLRRRFILCGTIRERNSETQTKSLRYQGAPLTLSGALPYSCSTRTVSGLSSRSTPGPPRGGFGASQRSPGPPAMFSIAQDRRGSVSFKTVRTSVSCLLVEYTMCACG